MPAFVYCTALRGVDDRAAHLAAHLVGQRDRRGFFDELLMAALDRALALAEMHDAAVMIAEHLEFDMARATHVLLDVNVADAERRFGLPLRRFQRRRQLLRRAHDAHAASAAAGRGLHDHRIADVLARPSVPAPRIDRAVTARQNRHARLLHRSARARLVAHQPDDLRDRSDEADVARFTDFRQVGALREESVARVNRVSAGDLRRADDGGNVQVALALRAGPMQTSSSANRTCREFSSASE